MPPQKAVLVLKHAEAFRLQRRALDHATAVFPYTTPFRSGAGVVLGELAELAQPLGELGDDRQQGLADRRRRVRSEEHTSELQSQSNLVCRLLLEKKNWRTTA